MVLHRLREQHLQHRRHHRAELQPVLGHQLQPPGRLEPPLEHRDAATLGVQSRDHHDEAVDVRERQRQQVAVDLGGATVGLQSPTGLEQPAVRQHDSLGAPGRAAGVEQGREVVVLARTDRLHVGVLELGEERDALRPVGLLAHDDEGDVEAGGRRVHERQQLGCHDRDPGAGVDEDVAQLRLGLQEDHRGHHGARAPDGAVADEHLRGVHHHHDDPVAGLDTQPAQSGSGACRALVDLARGVPPALEQQGVVVAEALLVALGQRGEVARPGISARHGSPKQRRRGSSPWPCLQDASSASWDTPAASGRDRSSGVGVRAKDDHPRTQQTGHRTTPIPRLTCNNFGRADRI